MNVFQFGKQRATAKGGKPIASRFSSSAASFMLEPILTPTAGIDGGDDAPDLAVFRPDDQGLHPHTLANVTLVSSDASDAYSSHSVVDHTVSMAEPYIAHTNNAHQPSDLVTPHLPDVVDCASLHPQFESGFFTVGDTGQVSVDFVFDGGGYQGQLAIFSLDGMEHFQPGSEDFMREAAHRALSHSDLGHVVINDVTDAARFSGSPGYESDFNSGEYQGVKTFAMRPGDRVGFMLVPDGTVQQVLENAAIDGSQRPLFSMATANPHDGLQAGQIADVTGDGNTFVFEDLRVDGHSDRDYNDVIFQLKGATGHTANLDDVIDAHHDWRSTDLGKAILSYAVPAGVDPHFDAPQANQPFIGVIDTGFSAHNPDIDYSHITLGHDWVDGDNNPLLQPGEGNDHGTHILGIIGATRDNGIGIDGINDHAPLWAGRAVGSGHWADSLVEFVDAAKDSGHHNAVVNLSLDLTQINPDGSVTTRYEFTPAEYAALEYAHQNHVLIVAAAGNDGGTMSILGQASQEFDNIITVGAADGSDRADYSSYGDGLAILAPGGTAANPILSTVGDGIGTLTGTSVATAEVTGAISQVWAANPALGYRQVIEILKATATDMQTPGWDRETGSGLLNIIAAVGLAKITLPEEYVSPAIAIPDTWSGEGLVTPFDRAADIAQSVIDNLVNSLPYPEWRQFARTSIPLILAEALAAGIRDLAQIAYILATSEHESHAGQLMNEIWGPTPDQLTYQGRLGNTQPGDGYRYRGRGYVQITGRSNYTAWSQRLGIDLVSQPEKATDPAIAAKIIVQGMRDGSFTGKKLSDYISGSNQDFYNARRIVNGMVPSQAVYVADIAKRYYDILKGSSLVTPIQPPSTQTTRRAYVVRAGDTLWAIAQREWGDGNRWREIQKADGSAFTEAEARVLQIGQTVYLPVKYTVGTGVPVTPAPITSPTPISVGSLSPSPALFQDAYNRAGGAANGWTPTGHAYRWGNGWTQEFRNANGDRLLLMLEDGADKAYIVFGSNLVEYEFMGGSVGRGLDGRKVELGYPRSDENVFQKDGKRAVWQAFAGENGKARIHNLYGFASVATWGTIGGLYTDMGGAGSFLGMPTRREYFDGDTVFADFQGGRIAYQASSGKTEALHSGEQPSWRQQQFFEESVGGSEWRASVFKWSGNQPPVNFWENSANGLAVLNLGSNVRSDGKQGVNFQDWGTGSPKGDPRLPSDAFVIRSYTQTHFEAGKKYKARVRADDGYQLLAKKWDTQQWVYFTPKDEWMTDAYGAYKEIEFQVPETGWYDFHFHYYEAGGNAYFDLAWEEINQFPKTTSTGTIITPTPENLSKLQNGGFDGQRLTDNYGGYLGECVSLIKKLSGNNATTEQWRKGENVIANGNVPIGTAIATFNGSNGTYTTPGNARQHVAIFAGYVRDSSGKIIGFDVWDQNFPVGSGVRKHTLSVNGNYSYNSDADYYYAVRV